MCSQSESEGTSSAEPYLGPEEVGKCSDNGEEEEEADDESTMSSGDGNNFFFQFIRQLPIVGTLCKLPLDEVPLLPTSLFQVNHYTQTLIR